MNSLDLKHASRPMPSDSSNASGLEVLGKDVKRLMDAIQRLRHLGFESSVVPLPKIVVVGDQSTGKSSVIEGISGVKVPRSAGTCTRCPLEINLSNSDDPWQCKIYLSRRYHYHPSKTSAVNSKHPLGPWQALSRPEEQDFATLYSRDDVAHALVWAQLATLNPGSNSQLYKPGHNDGTLKLNQVAFSPNVVRLDISGPGLPNLAFYDLPGLISHVSDEKEAYVLKLVENLAKEYIKPENTVILLTLTMNHDVQNSKAAGLIQKAHADDRTVGVFTKPDCMSPDQESLFAKIFQQHDFRRKLGYFCVKNNVDPSVDNVTAREEEGNFFMEWSCKYPELGRFKGRFGTLRLQEELSKLLANHIRSSLPQIRQIVNGKMAHVQAELEKLPKAPSGNLSLDISNNICSLKRELECLFDNNSEKFACFGSWQHLTRRFRMDLTDSHPRLREARLSGSLEATSRSPRTPIPSRETAELIAIEDDDEHIAATPSLTLSRGQKREPPTEISPAAKRLRMESVPLQGARSHAKVFTLEAIRDLISSKDDTGLPGSQNPRVLKDMYGQSNGHWGRVMQDYINKTCNLYGAAIMESLRKAFGKQQKTRLLAEVEANAKEFITSAFSEQGKFAQRCLNMEKIVMTLDPKAIEPLKETSLEEMQRQRRVELAQQANGDEEITSSSLTDSKRRERTKTTKAANQPASQDEFERELKQMATVQAYYRYAATRFAEYIALSFRSELFVKLERELCPHLASRLRLEESDANLHIRALLEVSQDDAHSRLRFEEELIMLGDGLKQLHELHDKGSALDSQTSEQAAVHSENGSDEGSYDVAT